MALNLQITGEKAKLTAAIRAMSANTADTETLKRQAAQGTDLSAVSQQLKHFANARYLPIIQWQKMQSSQKSFRCSGAA
jgi:hypothetical protein